MSWYGRLYDDTNMGRTVVGYTGEGPTYYNIRHVEAIKEAAEYRRLHLHKWLMEQWGMTDE